MAKKAFDMMVWYDEDVYGKAWTKVEAETEEEARAIFLKAFEEGKEWDFDWDFHEKGGAGIRFSTEDIECRCYERKD